MFHNHSNPDTMNRYPPKYTYFCPDNSDIVNMSSCNTYTFFAKRRNASFYVNTLLHKELSLLGIVPSLPFLLTFDILFRMQNDQPPPSSLPADRFASHTKYRKWTKMATCLFLWHIKRLFVSERLMIIV